MKSYDFLALYRDKCLMPITVDINDEKGETLTDAWIRACRVADRSKELLNLWRANEIFDGDRGEIVTDQSEDPDDTDDMRFVSCLFCDDTLTCHIRGCKMKYANHRMCDECEYHTTLSEARDFLAGLNKKADEDYINKPIDFGKAITLLKVGFKVRRKGWNGKGIYLELQRPDEHSKMTLPYIYIVTTDLESNNPDAPRGVVPWLASQTDMLSEDWEVVDE